MRNIFFAAAILVLGCTAVPAGTHNILGSWSSADGTLRYEVIDGLKPNMGAVLAFSEHDELTLGSWEFDGESYFLRVGWTSGPVDFFGDTTMIFRRTAFERIGCLEETNITSIKTDEKGFIDSLLQNLWLDINNDETVVFRTTFSTDSGVKESYSRSGTFNSFESWGVGSGVMKIGSATIIDARVSSQYFVGINSHDRFVVYKAQGKPSQIERTQLRDKREQFLAALTTDSWYTKGFFTPDTIFRFRPIESELKGRVISTRDNLLHTSNTWEYSLEKGSLKIGFTEYTGAMVVGDTLAFVDNRGNQQFYRRTPQGDNYRFTVSDVRTVPLSESNADTIRSMLSGQFQEGSFFYTFEFSDDGLHGHMHKFVSEPFTLTGNNLICPLLRSQNAKTLWTVEDVVIFDNGDVFKRDTRSVRLAALSDDQSQALQRHNKVITESLLEKHLAIRIRTSDGRTIHIPLPVSSFDEITDISIFAD